MTVLKIVVESEGVKSNRIEVFCCVEDLKGKPEEFYEVGELRFSYSENNLYLIKDK